MAKQKKIFEEKLAENVETTATPAYIVQLNSFLGKLGSYNVEQDHQVLVSNISRQEAITIAQNINKEQFNLVSVKEFFNQPD